MKKILKNVLLGIAWGCTMSCIVYTVIAFCIGEINFTADEWLGQLIASAVVGIGFYLPSLVYSSERLSMGIKILSHLAAGFAVFFTAAFSIGWIPPKTEIIFVPLFIAATLIIYFFFWLYYKSEAKKINDKIKDKQA